MIKSQDDLNTCNDGKRSSEVLIKTIEKCEKLQNQLDLALHCLKEYSRSGCNPLAQKPLKQIKELDK